MRVLVTAIGSFSAGVVIKIMKYMGWDVIGCNCYPREWIVEGNCVHKFYQSPRGDDAGYMQFILELIEKEHITHLIPLTDVEVDVLSRNRKKLEETNVVLCISQAHSILTCRNKFLFQKVLRENDIKSAIPTYWYEDFIKSELLKSGTNWICKPVNGRSSQGIFFINSKDSSQMIFSEPEKGRYIVQPMVGNQDSHVVTVDIIRQPDYQQFVAMPRRELVRNSNGAGITVEIFENKRLTLLCKKMSDVLDIRGCVNFEFIEDEENYHVLECNPRFSGGVEFSCMSGYDFITNHMRCFLGERIDSISKNYPRQIIARKYEAYITRRE